MRIQFKVTQNIVYIKPNSELDIILAEELETGLNKILNLGHYLFIFDFEDMNWICSLGVQCILKVSKISASKGYKSIILNSNEILKEQ